MKKRFTKIIGLALAAGLAAASFTGCSDKINGNETALVVNGENVSLGEANFILRYQQAETYYYMGMMGMASSDFWSSAYDENSSYGEYYKNSTYDMIVQLLAVKQKAVNEYNVEITEEEEESIASAAKEFMDANPNAENDFGVTLEQVENVLRLYTYSNNIRPMLTGDVDRNVSDDEAAQTTILYTRIKKNTDDETTGETAENSSDEDSKSNEELYAQTEELLEKLKDAGELTSDEVNSTADEINKDFFAMQYSYGKDDTGFSQEVKDAVLDLKDGEYYDGIIDSDDYYYIVKLVSAFDREATDSKKESIIKERENDAINEYFTQWRDEASVSKKGCWNNLELKDKEIYTVVVPQQTSSSESSAE